MYIGTYNISLIYRGGIRNYYFFIYQGFFVAIYWKLENYLVNG